MRFIEKYGTGMSPYARLVKDDGTQLEWDFEHGGWHPVEKKKKEVTPTSNLPKVKEVLHNNPATIVWFEDGTKEVSKIEDGDVYDKEVGVAICLAKKAFGRQYYREVMNKFVYTDDKPFDNVKPAEIPTRKHDFHFRREGK